MVEATGHFGIVRINGYIDPHAVQNGCIVGNGINDFVFVGPPIGKTAGVYAVGFHFVGDLESFQNVGKGVDLEAHRVGHLHQHIDFGLNVGMAGDVALVQTNFLKGFHRQVFAVKVSRFLAVFLVLDGTKKTVQNGLFHAHSGLGKTDGVTIAPVGLFDIFAKRKFDEAGGPFKLKLLGIGNAPTHAD